MELKSRSFVKTVVYRILAILATIPFTGLTTALELHLILAIIYYVHERVWSRINWGKELL